MATTKRSSFNYSSTEGRPDIDPQSERDGGAGNDILTGGIGNDTLIGGLGADRFKFDLPSEGVDLIKDFNRSESEGDKIAISSSLGVTSLNQFSYNSDTGGLFFSAPSGLFQLATLENKPAGFSPQLDMIIV